MKKPEKKKVIKESVKVAKTKVADENPMPKPPPIK